MADTDEGTFTFSPKLEKPVEEMKVIEKVIKKVIEKVEEVKQVGSVEDRIRPFVVLVDTPTKSPAIRKAV